MASNGAEWFEGSRMALNGFEWSRLTQEGADAEVTLVS